MLVSIAVSVVDPGRTRSCKLDFSTDRPQAVWFPKRPFALQPITPEDLNANGGRLRRGVAIVRLVRGKICLHEQAVLVRPDALQRINLNDLAGRNRLNIHKDPFSLNRTVHEGSSKSTSPSRSAVVDSRTAQWLSSGWVSKSIGVGPYPFGEFYVRSDATK